MKRYFIERLVAEKVESVLKTINNDDHNSTKRDNGLKQYRFSSKYLKEERAKLKNAGKAKEGGEGKLYDKHRTAVETVRMRNGKRRAASSRKRLTGIYAVLHEPKGIDKRFAGMSKDGKSEIWWGEKAQTDWLFLA